MQLGANKLYMSPLLEPSLYLTSDFPFSMQSSVDYPNAAQVSALYPSYYNSVLPGDPYTSLPGANLNEIYRFAEPPAPTKEYIVLDDKKKAAADSDSEASDYEETPVVGNLVDKASALQLDTLYNAYPLGAMGVAPPVEQYVQYQPRLHPRFQQQIVANPFPHVPKSVNVYWPKYMGTWYEIAALPNEFESTCVGAVAQYSMNPHRNEISVVNTCVLSNGSTTSLRGKAVVVGPGRLFITFGAPAPYTPIPLQQLGNYWVLEHDPSYQYAVVGTPDRRYLWILSRTPSMDMDTLADVLARIVNVHGYGIDRLVFRGNVY